jgi:phage terminase small subunit
MLSERERRFVDAYMGEAAGNATKAAKLAGYSAHTATTLGSRLLRKVHVADAIAQIQAASTAAIVAERDESIADRAERQRFWTEFMRGSDVHPLARLKASELLGKSNADFVDRVHHSGQVTAPQAVTFVFQVQA